MKKKTANGKLYIALTALSLVLAGFACKSQYDTVDGTKVKVAELRQQLEDQGDVNAELSEITAKVAESKQKLDHLEQGVPQLAYIPTMMTELESLGQRNGILVTGVRPMADKFPKTPPKEGEKEVKPAYQEQFIEVKGSGHYLRVLAFLAELERFPKIVQVQTVTLTPKESAASSNGKDPSFLEITVEIKAFLFPQAGPSSSEKSLTMGESNGKRA